MSLHTTETEAIRYMRKYSYAEGEPYVVIPNTREEEVYSNEPGCCDSRIKEYHEFFVVSLEEFYQDNYSQYIHYFDEAEVD